MASVESALHLWRAREILKPKSVQLYLMFNSEAAQVALDELRSSDHTGIECGAAKPCPRGMNYLARSPVTLIAKL